MHYRSNRSRLWTMIKQAIAKVKEDESDSNANLESLSCFFGNLVAASSPPHPLAVPLGPSSENDFTEFEPFSVDYVQSLLAKSNCSKSAGPNNISPPFLKALAVQLAPSVSAVQPLSHVCKNFSCFQASRSLPISTIEAWDKPVQYSVVCH